MPFETSFDVPSAVWTERLFGEITLDDLMGVYQAKVVSVAPGVQLKVLSDITDADPRAVSTSDLRRFADHVNASPEAVCAWRLAIVSGTDLQFGLARLFQSTCVALTQTEVFRSAREARAWLGLPPGAALGHEP